MTQWTDYCQEYSKKHGITYKEANQQCSSSYKEYKKSIQKDKPPQKKKPKKIKKTKVSKKPPAQENLNPFVDF
jgi:hypothetical protein